MDESYIIRISGWKAKLEVIPLIHLFKQYGFGLAESKRIADSILDLEPVEIVLPSAKTANDLCTQASELGAECSWSKQV